MSNRHRGEVTAELDGKTFRLALTLGALAELETTYQAADLVALVRRFETSQLAAGDLIRIIGAGLRGGGNSISDHQLAEMSHPDGVQGFVQLAATLLAATFGVSPAPQDNPSNPSVPQSA